ncbi:hypothetical protein ACWGOQ_0019500 [Aquimarina sp. M1]
MSCTSQSRLDLSEIRMPYDASNLINGKYNIKEETSTLEHFQKYKSEDEKLFKFNTLNFQKQQSEKYFSSTILHLLVDNKSNKVKCIYLDTSIDADSKELYRLFLEKFGTPNYYNKDENFFNGIWELENTFFILKQNFTSQSEGSKTTKSRLIILQNDAPKLIEYYLYEGLANYLEFLKSKAEKQDSNYSYSQFAEDTKNDSFGEEKYSNELANNLPL